MPGGVSYTPFVRLIWIDDSDELHCPPVHQKEEPLYQFAIIPPSRPKRTPEKWLINVYVLLSLSLTRSRTTDARNHSL